MIVSTIPEKSLLSLKRIMLESHDVDLPLKEVEKLGVRLLTLYVAQHMINSERLQEVLSKPEENKALISMIERCWREDKRRALAEEERITLREQRKNEQSEGEKSYNRESRA